ncbi:MAG: hypothetical protein HC836_47135 [Richelia sp. RM2_1_2]|nr:hypothetical protein [Richelia sp. RM1_1_1]NJO65408.1 hypothetical protein [Richelia sp. RM2_1_2]
MKFLRAFKQDSGWIEINNFEVGYESLITSEYLPVAYRIIDKFCYFRGVVLRSNTISAISNIAFRLTPEAIPDYRINTFGVEWQTNDTVLSRSAIRINNNGEFTIFTTQSANLSVRRNISLDAVFYPI